MRVLLVEDNPNLAQSLNDALSAARFAVDHMADGEAADHVLRTQDYALVILDLGLPKLDGLEVLRRLRARRNPVPVLILTAHGSVEDRVKGLDLGADDYLAKPFELTELEARARADPPQPRPRALGSNAGRFRMTVSTAASILRASRCRSRRASARCSRC